MSIKTYGKMLMFLHLKIEALDDDLPDNLAKLGEATVVLDIGDDVDFDNALAIVQSSNLHAIGIIDGVHSEQARTHKLAIFPKSAKMQTVKPTAPSTPDAPAAKGESAPLHTSDTPLPARQNRVHAQMLRSGQSLVHLEGDLVVLGDINSGAEAISEGSLHLYGRGQGRLIAGATGDTQARIFCQKFMPQLVAVAGTYCLQEDIPAQMLGCAVMVRYDEQRGLVFEKMV